MRHLKSTFASFVLVFVTSEMLQAQQTATAQISGVVQDSSGAAIVGSEVRVTQTSTAFTRSATSGADGSYTIPNLPVGPYRLQATAPGFSAYSQDGIELRVNSNPVINPVLSVGGVTEQVTVTTNVAMAETHDSSISQVIDQQRIVDLPLNGRQATQLILLSGLSAQGLATDINTSKNYQSASVTLSIAGSQPNTNNFVMDGGDNNDAFSNLNKPFPFPDALQEFNVQASALQARYGLHSGGVVSIVTKSGSNKIHGNLFEFLRNGSVNARNFFAPKHDALKRNQFGGTLGGPIRKNKLFYFGGYQGTRIKTDPATTISTVPTAQVLTGDFTTILSSACTATPITLRAPFSGNRILPSQFNPQALNLAKYVPVSSDPCGKYQYGITNNSEEDQVIGRIDFNQSDRHSVFGRYFISDYRNPAVFDGKNLLITTKPGVAPRSQSLTLGDNFSFGPVTISSFHASFGRMRVLRNPPPDIVSPRDVGINISQYVDHFIYMDVTNFFSLGCGTCSPSYYTTNTFQIAEDVDLLRGAHQIGFGTNWLHYRLNSTGNNLSNGQFVFNGQISNYGMADFLMGTPSAFNQSNPQRQNVRENSIALYIQDSWKVSRRLTVNAGVRWEPFLPQWDRYGRGSHFELADFLANKRSSTYVNGPAGMAFHGDPGYGKSNTNADWNNFAPRIGFVIDPKSNGKQTLRASYGVLYDTPEVYYEVRFVSAPPFGNQLNITNPVGGLTNPYLNYPGGNPFPQAFPPPRDVAFPAAGVWINLPRNMKPTYLQQWNVSWQRQVSPNWLFTANYVGNKTTHHWIGTELNPAVPIAGATTGNTNSRRVLSLIEPVRGAPYATIGHADDGSNATYNGMLLSIQHRFANHFTNLTNYTWSHCINEADVNGDLTGPQYQDPANRRANRGNCGYDRRHVFNNSLVAVGPHFNSRIVQWVAGDWQLSGILSVSSGAFYNITLGRDNSLTGVGLDRPNLVGDPDLAHPTFDQWFNPAAFQASTPGTFGNLGRNTLRGPKFVNFDIGLVRQFPVREGTKLELRAEAFNAINHANLDSSVGNALRTALNDPRLGQITAAADPRILQFALKIQF